MYYVIVTDNKSVYNLATLKGAQIIQVPSHSMPELIQKNNLDNTISNFLTTNLGIPSHLEGFDYLTAIIKKSIEEPGFEKKGICTNIFPYCATLFNSSPCAIERALRWSSKIAYNARDNSNFKEIFGNLDQEPSPKPYVQTIVSYFKKNFI